MLGEIARAAMVTRRTRVWAQPRWLPGKRLPSYGCLVRLHGKFASCISAFRDYATARKAHRSAPGCHKTRRRQSQRYGGALPTRVAWFFKNWRPHFAPKPEILQVPQNSGVTLYKEDDQYLQQRFRIIFTRGLFAIICLIYFQRIIYYNIQLT